MAAIEPSCATVVALTSSPPITQAEAFDLGGGKGVKYDQVVHFAVGFR